MTETPTPDHAKWDREREAYIARSLAPGLQELFDQHRWIQSIGLLVAQYWDDEANDAVHCRLVLSQLERPDLEAHFDLDWDDRDVVNHSSEAPKDLWMVTWKTTRLWDRNGAAIPLFAAFCPEGGSQDSSERDNYRPYAVFTRTAGGFDTTVVGQMLRPWLDGVRPEWDD